jgi:hypothetical protein
LRNARWGQGLRPLAAAITLASAVVAAGGPASAAAPLEFGAKGGLSFARLRGGQLPPSNGYRTALAGGLSAMRIVATSVAIQGELLYVMKGSSFTPTESGDYWGTPGTGRARYAADYLEVPLLLRWQSPSSGVGFALLGGPFLGWKVAEHVTSDDGTDIEPEALTDTDWGFVLGAEFAFPASGGAWTIDARYDLGVADVLEPSAGTGPLQTGAWIAMVGFAFAPGR